MEGSQTPVEGRKNDSGKLRYDLIPPSTLRALATILTFGASKYSDRNWEVGIKWGRVFGALMRHLWAWWAGEEADPETGKSHLWHAQCCLSFLIEYEETRREFDDRPQKKAAKGTLGPLECMEDIPHDSLSLKRS